MNLIRTSDVNFLWL